MYKKNPLLRFAGIPVTGADIKSCFPDLASPEKKVQLLEKSGSLIRLKRNLFIVRLDELMTQLRNKITETNIENIKQDVIPYIDPSQLRTLDIWSNDYFLQLADMMKIEY